MAAYFTSHQWVGVAPIPPIRRAPLYRGGTAPRHTNRQNIRYLRGRPISRTWRRPKEPRRRLLYWAPWAARPNGCYVASYRDPFGLTPSPQRLHERCRLGVIYMGQVARHIALQFSAGGGAHGSCVSSGPTSPTKYLSVAAPHRARDRCPIYNANYW